MMDWRRSISPSRLSTALAISCTRWCNRAVSDGRFSRSNRMCESTLIRRFEEADSLYSIRVFALFQPARLGFQMRSGTRQSMPSISIASCAGDNVMEPS